MSERLIGLGLNDPNLTKGLSEARTIEPRAELAVLAARLLALVSETQDIRELKKQITHEVRELNRAVSEKQKQDEKSFAKLLRRVQVLQTNLTQTKEQASLDALTQVPNRGSFDRALGHWVATHKEKGKPFVLAMLDLDDFKQINDSHGHQVGDRVLFCAAQWFGKYLRTNDFLARYGGEEFVMMLSDTDLSEAGTRLSELLGKIAASTYEYSADGKECGVAFKASCGLAEFNLDESSEDLVRRADEALYVAKRTGKNRVALAKKRKVAGKLLAKNWRP